MRRQILTAVAALCMIALHGAQARAQAVASVCKDGTTSTAEGRGACSGHGGVDAKATAAAKKAAAAQVMCTDGTMSKAGRGACSSHGGVKGAATAKTEAKSQAPATKTAVRPDDNDSTGAIALCKNGKYSHATKHAGACSKAGGVSKFLKP
jgi:hypothetical protein